MSQRYSSSSRDDGHDGRGNNGGGRSDAARKAASRAFNNDGGGGDFGGGGAGAGGRYRPTSTRREHSTTSGGTQYNHHHHHQSGSKYASEFAEIDSTQSSEVAQQWKRAATHVLIATVATMVIAAIVLYATKPPMVREDKQHRFDEDRVSPKRVAMWSGASAATVAVVSSVYIYLRFKKESSSSS